MWRWWVIVVSIAVLLGGAAGLHSAYRKLTAPEPVPVVELRERPAPSVGRALIRQVHGGQTQMLECQARTCQMVEPPAADGELVTDGESWYYYADAIGKQSGLRKRVLLRQHRDSGAVEQVIEATKLASPRGLYVSPDGAKVAFFLDNIDRPEAELTELWVYEVATGGVRLLAEHLYRPDIRSTLRWNSASSQLFFLADTAPQAAPDRLELVVIGLKPVRVTTPFRTIDWQEQGALVESGVLDVSAEGRAVAYATSSFFGQSLVVDSDDGRPRQFSVRGPLVYLQWLPDGSLLYAEQLGRQFTVQQLTGTVRRQLRRENGELLTALAAGDSAELTMVVTSESARAQVAVVRLADGVEAAGATLSIAEATVLQRVWQATEAPVVTAVTVPLDDAQLIAFVDGHFSEILGGEALRPTRIVVTTEPNTLLVDYRTAQDKGGEQRVLLIVQDAVNREWTIRGRWQALQGEWHRSVTGTLPEPKAVRLYEWEAGVGRWILKNSL